jgi:hypothetical protein
MHEGLKERIKDCPPEFYNLLPDSLERLIEFYTKVLKPEEVKKYEAMRVKEPVNKK